MIRTVWPYLALMLLCAGVFPAIERRTDWRLFRVLPPIVLTYLLVTLAGVELADHQRFTLKWAVAVGVVMSVVAMATLVFPFVRG